MRKRQTRTKAMNGQANAKTEYIRLKPISFGARVKKLSKLVADITALRRQLRDSKDKETARHLGRQIAELEKHWKHIGKPVVRQREKLWTEMANIDRLVWVLRNEAKSAGNYQDEIKTLLDYKELLQKELDMLF